MAVTLGTPVTSTATTFAHTVVSADSILIVTVAHRNDGSVSGITYNGVSLTLGVSKSQGAGTSQANSSVWYLQSPSAGNNNIVITSSGTTEARFGAVEVFGVFSVGGSSSAGGTGGTRTTTLTVQGTTGVVIDSINEVAIGSLTVDGSQTTIFNATDGNSENGSSYEIHSGSNTTMSWTSSGGSADWAISALELKGTPTFTILDTITVSETPSASRGKSFILLETITLSEVVSGIRGMTISILDSLSLIEVFSTLVPWLRQTKNTATLSTQSKNNATASSQGKNTATLTNQTKNGDIPI